LVTPVPLSPLLLLCCAYGGGSIKISLQAMPYKTTVTFIVEQVQYSTVYDTFIEIGHPFVQNTVFCDVTVA
jgi:hypothetical protein